MGGRISTDEAASSANVTVDTDTFLFFASSNLNNKMQRAAEGVSALGYSQCCWQCLDEKLGV